ncbi:MAG: hypothetical protein OIN86_11370 [Candidatus Methanoperedens sp.]|nr:hypothetical protein [Candidatus Methanoperedens sp.]
MLILRGLKLLRLVQQGVTLLLTLVHTFRFQTSVYPSLTIVSAAMALIRPLLQYSTIAAKLDALSHHL